LRDEPPLGDEPERAVTVSRRAEADHDELAVAVATEDRLVAERDAVFRAA
jgi:hypothetical protein